MALTDAKIRNARPSAKPRKLTDSGGLYLEVRLSGAKLWRYRYRIAGREKRWPRFMRQFSGLAKVDRGVGYAANFSMCISIA